MKIKHKKSLSDIKQSLSEKRREDYRNGYLNYQETLNNLKEKENIYDKMADNTSKKSKVKWYKWIFSKKSKVGRFGQKKVDNKKLKKMADKMEKSKGETEYFDPMQQMSIDKEENTRGVMGEEFYNLVTDEANIAQENDFNSELTEEGKGYSVLAHLDKYRDVANDHETYSREYVREYEQRHDGLKEYVPDGEVMEGRPDNFAISVGVVGASRFYTEYTKESAKKRGENNIKEKLKGKEILSKEEESIKKEKDEDEVAQRAMEKTPLYKKLVAEGKKQNKKYNPKEDPLIENLKTEIKYQRTMGSTGHSFVRLIPKIRNMEKASYSFGFYTMGPGKIGGVDEGYVENPEPQIKGEGITEKEYKVPFSGYLKAVAKIRGISASGRKYSVVGYNCTSFAIEVAKAAGVSISDKDVATDMTTFDSRSERVDMPSSLQNLLFKEKLKAGELNFDPKMEHSPDKSVYARGINYDGHNEEITEDEQQQHQEEKFAEWVGLIKELPFMQEIYDGAHDEERYKKIIYSMLDIIESLSEKGLYDYLNNNGIQVDENYKWHPGYLIMDHACKEQQGFFDIARRGLTIPGRTPENYAISLEKEFENMGEAAIDDIIDNKYFEYNGLGRLTNETAKIVIEMIINFETDVIERLAQTNDPSDAIRFNYNFDDPVEIIEAAQQRMKWNNRLKRVYGGMEDIVGYMKLVIQQIDIMQQYLDNRPELKDDLWERLSGYV